MDIYWHIPCGLALLHAYMTAVSDDKVARSANVPISLGASGGMLLLDFLLNRNDRSFAQKAERIAFAVSGAYMLANMISMGEGNVVGGNGGGDTQASVDNAGGFPVIEAYLFSDDKFPPTHYATIKLPDGSVFSPTDRDSLINGLVGFPPSKAVARIIWNGATENAYDKLRDALKNGGYYVGESLEPCRVTDEWPTRNWSKQWDPK